MGPDEKTLLEEKYGGAPSAAFETDRARLANGEPLAYVIGHQPFLGLDIWLDSKPLIPRTETEWWTNELLQSLQSKASPDVPEMGVSQSDGARGGNFSAEKYAALSEDTSGEPLRFLDLCAGSGAIGCAALARLKNAQVYFGEIEPAHATTIEKNIRENQLDGSRAHVKIGDLFKQFAGLRFNVIAANPPYIPQDRALPESVTGFEPGAALFAGERGLGVIARIAEQLSLFLAPQGIAWIECDSEHARDASDLFLRKGFTADIRTDLYGRPRLIVVSLP
jgi:release factor glutamine methyltransferase